MIVFETNTLIELLDQFPELTRATAKGETVKHGIAHKIVTKGHPVFARPRRLAPDKLVTAKLEFDQMIKLGVIDPSNSEWSSALHIVPPKNGDCRLCGDYRSLNSQTVPDRYPIPHILVQIFTQWLDRTKVFSKIDLVRAYYHSEGISPSPIVDAIGNFVRPDKQRALRRYLGMANYYDRFVPDCAPKLTPLGP